MNTLREYRQCTKCVLDTTAKFITFDDAGVCNYCRGYESMAKKYVNIPAERKQKELDLIVSKIKRLGRGKKYDCILGLSGGVDSSYLAHLAVKLGLKPLVVHFDNGWNSELAVKNIQNIVEKLKLDLHTYVINWEEFKDLQVAYFRASVVDIEVPTDYLIFATLNKIARQYGIKYILSGYNYVTEFGMPKGWNISNKFDHVNLENIHKQFGRMKLKDFPKFGYYHRRFYEDLCGIETEPLLNHIEYNKKKVKEFLKTELDWKDYGGKHHESIFTRFYQDYVLPKKFDIDKRKAHWSALIWSGQATRDEALADIAKEPYPVQQQMEDREYVIKKLGFTSEEFEKIMNTPPVPHEHYGLEDPNSIGRKIFDKLIFIPMKIQKKLRYMRATGKFRN